MRNLLDKDLLDEHLANIEFGWESPIKMLHRELEMKFEDGAVKVVQSVGFDVDKEELLKALKYDREQYGKGYDSGWEGAISKFVTEIEAEYDNDASPNVTDYLDYRIPLRDLFEIAERIRHERSI